MSALEYDVFFSYSRKDARRDSFIGDVYNELTRCGLSVWFDKENMNQEDCTFSHTVQEAIKNSSRILLFVGSNVNESSFVESELRYAHRIGRKVYPILYSVKPDDIDARFTLVPERYKDKNIYDSTVMYNDEDRLALLQSITEEMKRPILMGRLSTNFKGLPQNYIPRYEYILKMEHHLFGDKESVSGEVIGGFFGGAGTGKSVIANAFCRDAEIRGQFQDGIIWINVKQSGNWQTVYQQLQEEYPELPKAFEEVEIKRVVREFFDGRNYLVVMDDVWEDNAKLISFFYDIFSDSLSHNKIVVTSRTRTVISAFTANPDKIENLSDEEAEQMLLLSERNVSGLPVALDDSARVIINRFHGHTLSISIACAMHRDGKSWKRILENIEREHARISRIDPYYDYPDAFSAISASVHTLTEELPYYRSLAVFFESKEYSFSGGKGIPLSAVVVLWKSLDPEMDEYKAKEIVSVFDNKCLVMYDEESATLNLHDLEFDYLNYEVLNEIDGLHREFVDIYKQLTGGEWASYIDDGYYYHHIIYHMLSAKNEYVDIAEDLMLDYMWIRKKLEICGCNSLLSDYQYAENRCRTHGEQVHFIGKAILLSASFLSADPRQLPTHFVGRMIEFEDPLIRDLLDQIYTKETDFWLRPTARCMLPPNSNLLNQWNIRANISCLASAINKIAVVHNGETRTIILFDIHKTESVFSWNTDSKVLSILIEENATKTTVLSADIDGRVLRWTVGNPKPIPVFSAAEPIYFIEKLESGAYIYISREGKILNEIGTVFKKEHSCTITACCMFGDELFLGCTNGCIRILNLKSGVEGIIKITNVPEVTLCDIAVSDSFIGIELIENLEDETKRCADIVLLDRRLPVNKQSANRGVIHCGNTIGGGLHFINGSQLIYTTGIFAYNYDVKKQKAEAIAINEHWIYGSALLRDVIVCTDNYGHICCFDTQSTFVNSFNAYDTFAMRTMVNTESFGSLETGIRGVPVPYTDMIFKPEYRVSDGISPVSYCMALTSDGIIYADEENGPCLFRTGEKYPLRASGNWTKPLCAVNYKGYPVIGFENGEIRIYDQNFREHLFYDIRTSVDVMCSCEESLFCASGSTVIKIQADNTTQQKSFDGYVTHLYASSRYLFVVFGNHQICCCRIGDFCETEMLNEWNGLTVDEIAEVITGAGFVFYVTKSGMVYNRDLGDFQLAYRSRHNKKDRKSYCIDDVILYCDNTVGNSFALKALEIGSDSDEVLEEINSAVFLSITSFEGYLLTGSQQDDICIWDYKTRTLLRRINTDSILRAIGVVNGYLAFVSGSHIFWLKVENPDNL